VQHHVHVGSRRGLLEALGLPSLAQLQTGVLSVAQGDRPLL
jgi:hypothetical protein